MIGATRYAAATEIDRQVRLSTELAKLEASVSSQKKVSISSDNPAAASRIAEIRQEQANTATWLKNSDTGAAIGSAVDSKLDAVSTALNRAKEQLLAGRTDTSSPENRKSIAIELGGIQEDIQGYAAANDPYGRPLFPVNDPILIPLSNTLSIAATDKQQNIFGSVTTAGGTKSIDTILTAAATALNAGDTAGMSDSLAELDAAILHIDTVRTDQGLRSARFDDAKERLSSGSIDLASERSDLEDTDMTYALSEIQAKQLSLQAAQTAFAHTHKSTLFDLIG